VFQSLSNIYPNTSLKLKIKPVIMPRIKDHDIPCINSHYAVWQFPMIKNMIIGVPALLISVEKAFVRPIW
jgi:hypothetical protein